MTGRGAQAESGGTRSTGQTGPAVAFPRIAEVVVAVDAGAGEPETTGEALGSGAPVPEALAETEHPARRSVPTSETRTTPRRRCRRSMTKGRRPGRSGSARPRWPQ